MTIAGIREKYRLTAKHRRANSKHTAKMRDATVPMRMLKTLSQMRAIISLQLIAGMSGCSLCCSLRARISLYRSMSWRYLQNLRSSLMSGALSIFPLRGFENLSKYSSSYLSMRKSKISSEYTNILLPFALFADSFRASSRAHHPSERSRFNSVLEIACCVRPKSNAMSETFHSIRFSSATKCVRLGARREYFSSR